MLQGTLLDRGGVRIFGCCEIKTDSGVRAKRTFEQGNIVVHLLSEHGLLFLLRPPAPTGADGIGGREYASTRPSNHTMARAPVQTDDAF